MDTRKVKAPNGLVMELPDVTASGLVNGSEDWTYADDGPVKEPVPVEVRPEYQVVVEAAAVTKIDETVPGDGVIATPGKIPSPESLTAADDPVPDPEKAADGADSLEAPAGNASRDDWAEYAVAKGYSAADLERYSRNEIRDLVNGSAGTDTEDTTE